MKNRRAIALALMGLVVGACSLGNQHVAILADPSMTAPTASPANPPPAAIGLGDLPTGWAMVHEDPPSRVESVLKRLATCLHVKLHAIAAETLQGPTEVFASADRREWVTAAAGPALGFTWPTFSTEVQTTAFTACATRAVTEDIASSHRPAGMAAVSVAPDSNTVASHAIDLRVSVPTATIVGPATIYVDTVWITGGSYAAVLDVTDEVLPGDLKSADQGIVDQASDAAARRISGR